MVIQVGGIPPTCIYDSERFPHILSYYRSWRMTIKMTCPGKYKFCKTRYWTEISQELFISKTYFIFEIKLNLKRFNKLNTQNIIHKQMQ